MENNKKIRVEIWSDVMCPFCYIGKRRFEAALERFGSEKVEVEWKSFQLNPDQETDATKSTLDYLSEHKGWSREQTRQAMSQVSAMAESVGLTYNFEKAVVANSFDAHRLIQLAKVYKRDDVLEELLFRSYFVEGKNTADHTVLNDLGLQAGLDPAEIKKVLQSDAFAAEVKQDINQAAAFGINAVPCFVMNRKYAVRGAQEVAVFVQTLEAAWAEQ